MDFVAIDFETANRRSESACQLAAVTVKRSEIVAEYCWLIRPPRNYFSPLNISIHGIRPSDVVDSPRMDFVWEKLAPVIDGQPLIAHNAGFDVNVLVSSLAAYGIACPHLQFQCTRTLARSAWPHLSGYGLKSLGNWLGISFKHHDALEDARCCAQIALTIQAQRGLSGSLAELEQGLQVVRGSYHGGQLVTPKRIGGSSARHSRGSGNIGVSQDAASFDRSGFPVGTSTTSVGRVCSETILNSCHEKPLLGKRIVMLGPLRGLSMEQTVQLLGQLGADVQKEIGSGTDYVVVPGAGRGATVNVKAPREVPDRQSAPDEHNRRLVGPGVRVLSERQFRALLPGGAARFR